MAEPQPPENAAPTLIAPLRSMINAYRLSQALYVAATLGIADRLAGGTGTPDELARAVGAHPDGLYRLMRALAGQGILIEGENRSFALAPLGFPLRTDAPVSLHDDAILTGELFWPAYGALLHSVQSGQPAFDHVYGMNVF